MKKLVFLLLSIAFTLSCTATVTVTSDVTAKKHPPKTEVNSVESVDFDVLDFMFSATYFKSDIYDTNIHYWYDFAMPSYVSPFSVDIDRPPLQNII